MQQRVWEDSEKRTSQKMQVREKVDKSGRGRSKSRFAQAARAEPSGGKSDQKLHATVAPSTLQSQNVESTLLSEHFWKLRCSKSACGLWRAANSEINM